MEIWKTAVLVVAGFCLTGCGSLCDRAEDVLADYAKKAQPCLQPGETITPFNTNACEENLDKCSDTEKEQIEKFFDCLDDLDECNPAAAETFGNASIACTTHVQSVGATCGTAFQ